VRRHDQGQRTEQPRQPRHHLNRQVGLRAFADAGAGVGDQRLRVDPRREAVKAADRGIASQEVGPFTLRRRPNLGARQSKCRFAKARPETNFK
jgi:hypothetical protein